jgi:hypothetical protein
MANKKKGGFSTSLLSLVFLVPKLFSFVGNIGPLIKLEAIHAKRNISIILLLILICAVLVTSTWMCLLALLYIYLTAHLAPIPALAIVILFNLFLLIILTLVIVLTKRNMFFPATFSQLSKSKLKL